MALKTVVTELESVEEQYRDLYEEQEHDGETVYVLQVEGVDHHPEVAALRNAYRAEQDKRKKLSGQAQELERLKSQLPEDFDPGQWEELKRKAEQSGDDAKIKQVQQEYERKLQEAQQEAEQLRNQIRTNAVERELTAALEAAGVTDPGLKEGAMALLKGQVQLDDNGTPQMDTNLGPRPVADAVKQWAQTERGQAFVSRPTGSGAKGSTGSNAQRKRFQDMTGAELADLKRQDPQEYKRLRDEFYGGN